MTNEEQNQMNEAQHAAIDNKLDYIIDKVDRVDEAIYGNGKPGLKVEVAGHSQTLAIMKKVFWWIAGVSGTIIGGLALAALV